MQTSMFLAINGIEKESGGNGVNTDTGEKRIRIMKKKKKERNFKKQFWNVLLLCMIFPTASALMEPNYLSNVLYYFPYFFLYFTKTVRTIPASANRQVKEQLFSNGC